MAASSLFAIMVWEGPHLPSGAEIVERATNRHIGYVVYVRPGKWTAYAGGPGWEAKVGDARLRREAAALVWQHRTRPVESTVGL